MVSFLKIRLQTNLNRPLCANGDYHNFEQIYSLLLETLGAFKIVIFRSTSLKLGSLNWKLYVDFKTGFNLKNPITNESLDYHFLDTLYVLRFGLFTSLTFVFLPLKT